MTSDNRRQTNKTMRRVNNPFFIFYGVVDTSLRENMLKIINLLILLILRIFATRNKNHFMYGDLFKNKYRIASARADWHDYNHGYYFITICTHEKQCIFGLPGNLNDFGRITERHIQNIPSFYRNIFIDKYVVMPNHIHMILVLNNGDDNAAVPLIIGQFKRGVTKEIRSVYPDRIIWQRSFHDHVIRNQTGYEKIWTYIDNNPLKWEEDCFFCKLSDNALREGWKPSPTK